jgi:2-isopropylmalate synthase
LLGGKNSSLPPLSVEGEGKSRYVKKEVISPREGIMDKVIIFDTTLRDGEQAAGGMLNIGEKLEIARQLEKLGVDVIEAGFPISSPGDFEAVKRIAGEVRESTICGLARAHPDDIDRAWEAIKEAESPRIHVFLSASDVHLMHQLKKSREEVLETSRAMVVRAKSYTRDIEFSPMDASRTEPEYLYRILEAVIEAGATTVNIPDTVGYAIPEEFGDLIEGIFKNVPNIDRAVVSVHCHNDLGLAVANSLESVRRGARQVECTINGIGERAGNASLEEIVMAINTRGDLFNLTTNVNTTEIYRTSRLVSELTGFVVQPNKAIVGANAFRHESGIHQDGVIKMPITYEIMDPRTVGIPSSSLVLGKLSGRHAFKERLQELGYGLTEEDLNRAFLAFKELADKKKEVTAKDIESLVAEEQRTVSETYHLDRIQVSCGDRGIPTAAVRLIAPGGEVMEDAALGTGPVDAVYKAINRLVGVTNELTEFSVKSVTEGIDAIGEVLIRIESEGVNYTGRGADTDIIVASAKAYINALNRLLAARKGSG